VVSVRKGGGKADTREVKSEKEPRESLARCYRDAKRRNARFVGGKEKKAGN